MIATTTKATKACIENRLDLLTKWIKKDSSFSVRFDELPEREQRDIAIALGDIIAAIDVVL